MKLFLLRHGQAEPQAHDDAARRLTGLGKRDVEKVAQLFAAKSETLTHCFYSPYVRTTQTVQVFLQHAGVQVHEESLALLTPEHSAKTVLGYLAALPQTEQASVLLVSHNPLVSELLAVLTDTEHANLHIVSTSELNVLAVEVPASGQGTLLYRLQP